MKKIIIIIYSLFLLTPILSFADVEQPIQPQIKSPNQQTLIVNKEDKERIHQFHEQVKQKIQNHRTEMHTKKQAIELAKSNLKNEVDSFKSQGKLSESKKSDLKSKLANIESQEEQLRKENINFINQLDEERETFFASIKSKK